MKMKKKTKKQPQLQNNVKSTIVKEQKLYALHGFRFKIGSSDQITGEQSGPLAMSL